MVVLACKLVGKLLSCTSIRMHKSCESKGGVPRTLMNCKLKYGLGFLTFLVLCSVFWWRAGQMSSTETLLWYSIIPPLLAVTLAIVTGRLFPSLCIAVGVGLLLSWYQKGVTPSNFLTEVVWFVRAVSVGNDGIDLFNFWVILFVCLIMATISVVVASGGISGVVVWLSRFAKGPRSAQFITGLMGIVIFIGDYSNAMLVGPTMRPLTDHHRVSREKLAFLVDSTSAPIAGLAFVSTWIGYEVGLFEDISGTLGLGRDGYSMFFDALSFRFYCVLAIVFVIVNALSGKDYGPMRTAETRARETGDVAAPDAEALGHAVSFTSLPNAVVQPLSAVLPLFALLGLLLGGFWIDGNGTGSILSLTAWRNALSEANNVMVLASAAASAFVISIVCARWLSKLRFSEITPVVWRGVKGSFTPLGILLLAWGLKASCDRLMTGDFLATMLSDVVSPLWFPIFVFICASVTSFA
ncbi:hypothetical protein F4Y93_06840, partial [Candidatus Poribacteria bacterium]|nr:hypothetical protein [Candidatus Poribacteria bacterium]